MGVGRNMRYMGGKFRQSKYIVKVLKDLGCNKDSTYVEPFCGAMWSASAVARDIKPNKLILSDINQYVINMWNALIYDDCKLPTHLTEEEYKYYKNNKPIDDWRTAFVGFDMSFGGKWFGGLARMKYDKLNDRYDFISGVNSTMKVVEILKKSNIEIGCFTYLKYRDVVGSYIYLDPPYENRVKCHNFDGKFDYIEFWDFARHISKNNIVIVTCFNCPEDFKTLYNFGDTVVRHLNSKGKDGTNENIVKYNG